MLTCLLQDKNKDNRGPRCTLEDGTPIQSVRCVIGTEFVKSKEGVTFLKCSTGRGWLPLHTPNVCVRMSFTHFAFSPALDAQVECSSE